MFKQFRRWRYMRITGKEWRRFFAGRITLVELERGLWLAWVYFKGGRKWRKSKTAAEILKERNDVIKDVHIVLKEYNKF